MNALLGQRRFERAITAMPAVVAVGFVAGLFPVTKAWTRGCRSSPGAWSRRYPARRVVTAIPALVVLAWGVDPTWALVISQVVLSFGIPLALIPLGVLVSRRSVMGDQANGWIVVVIAGLATAAIVALNLVLLALTAAG